MAPGFCFCWLGMRSYSTLQTKPGQPVCYIDPLQMAATFNTWTCVIHLYIHVFFWWMCLFLLVIHFHFGALAQFGRGKLIGQKASTFCNEFCFRHGRCFWHDSIGINWLSKSEIHSQSSPSPHSTIKCHLNRIFPRSTFMLCIFLLFCQISQD